jgi:hypothetical protein
MMEHALVSVATGVLSPLLGKLSSMVEKEYIQLKEVRKEIISLQEELGSMNALLERLAAEEEPDIQVGLVHVSFQDPFRGFSNLNQKSIAR